MPQTPSPQHLKINTDTRPIQDRRDGDVATLKSELKKILRIKKAPNGSEAYFLHIGNRATARRSSNFFSEQDYLRYFVDMVKYFTARSGKEKKAPETLSIGAFIKYVLEDLEKHRGDKSPLRDSKIDLLDTITDQVFCMLGAWLAMESYFQEGSQRTRPIERTTGDDATQLKPAVECNLDELLYRCPAVPCIGKSDVHKLWQTSSSVKDTAGGTKTSDSNDAGAQNRQTSGALSELLPRGEFDPSLDLEESSYITVSDLNLYTLKTLAAVDVHWTTNMARHLLLSKSHGRTTVEVFSLPSTLSTAFPRAMSGSLVQEVASSYVRLFNIDLDVGSYIIISNTMQPHNATILSPHRSIAERMILRSLWCWCRKCAYCRASRQALTSLKREMCCPLDGRHSVESGSEGGQGSPGFDLFDPAIWFYMGPSPKRDWKPETFPSLWPRIVALREYQDRAKPWNLRSLFRDRRDTANWWGMMCVSPA